MFSLCYFCTSISCTKRPLSRSTDWRFTLCVYPTCIWKRYVSSHKQLGQSSSVADCHGLSDNCRGIVTYQRYNTLTLCLVDSVNFATNISCVKIVKTVLDTHKTIISAIEIDGIEVIIDCNIVYTILLKGKVGVRPCQCRGMLQVTYINKDIDSYLSCFNFRRHCLKIRVVIGHTIIHKKCEIGKVDFPYISQKYILLFFNGQRLSSVFIFLQKWQ